MAEDVTHDGGCLCGNVRYTASGAPSSLCYCHCRSCQQAAGAPLLAWGTWPTAALVFTHGEPTRFRSSPRVVRSFCGRCGTALTYLHEQRPDDIDLSLTTLDTAVSFAPGYHIWVADKVPWLNIDDGLPQHDGWRT